MQPRKYLPFFFLYIIAVTFCGISSAATRTPASTSIDCEAQQNRENRSVCVRTGEIPSIIGLNYFFDRYAEASENDAKFDKVFKRPIVEKFSVDSRREGAGGIRAPRENVTIAVLLHAVIRI